MAKDEESPVPSGEGVGSGGAADEQMEEWALRFGLALLPIFLRRVTLVEEPPRRRR